MELHGSVHRNYCTRCGKFHRLADIMAMDGRADLVVSGRIGEVFSQIVAR